MAKLKWMVVREMVETETASFWYESPEVKRGELKTEEIGDGSVFVAGGGARGEGGDVHEHAATVAMAAEGGRAAGRCAQRKLVHVSPGATC